MSWPSSSTATLSCAPKRVSRFRICARDASSCRRVRCSVVSAIRGVDFVIPFEIENDPTVSRALEIIKPNVFAKGGDRVDKETIPEWEVCEKHNIEIVTEVGLKKEWSSSQFLKEWEEHFMKR